MKTDKLSDISYLKAQILSKVNDNALKEKVRHTRSLTLLRSILYQVENPVRIDPYKMYDL